MLLLITVLLWIGREKRSISVVLKYMSNEGFMVLLGFLQGWSKDVHAWRIYYVELGLNLDSNFHIYHMTAWLCTQHFILTLGLDFRRSFSSRWNGANMLLFKDNMWGRVIFYSWLLYQGGLGLACSIYMKNSKKSHPPWHTTWPLHNCIGRKGVLLIHLPRGSNGWWARYACSLKEVHQPGWIQASWTQPS